MLTRLASAMFVALFLLASPARATWSIVLVDESTGEIAVGTVTCLTSFDLLAIVPVVVVGEGGAAVQASGDFNGIRRPIIFQEFLDGTPPADILTILAGIGGHQSRQYGIVDRTDAVTFTGASTLAWAGGVTGQQGTMRYAIQGNILAGSCVVPAIEAAVLGTDGDLAEKLMAGMVAARDTGGDGRCSCDAGPTDCGCPVVGAKSGHIGGMVVSRIGDTDDAACNASGCVDGDYFMRLNVAFQGSGSPDPVDQLQGQFDTWRGALVGRADAVRTLVTFDPPIIPPNGVSTTTMTIAPRDFAGNAVTTAIIDAAVTHAPDSAGLTTIGTPVIQPDGTIAVPLTAGDAPGIDRFVITLDDGVRPVVLTPPPAFELFAAGDLDGDGAVAIGDLLAMLAAWGPCAPGDAACAAADLDGDGIVGIADVLALLAAWS